MGNQTATPTFSPGPGTYNTSQTVTISDATAGAVLYCTTDGTTPTTSSPKCAQPTTVFKSQFLQAIAAAPGKNPSAVASAGYTISLNAAATPTFSPAGGNVAAGQTVTIADATSGANIYYTTDGTVPSASSNLYTAPIAINTAQTISAIAIASGYSDSGVASAAYTISGSVAVPVFSVPTGNYSSPQTVTITDADPNATIYYAINNSTPSASSTQYTGPITVSQTQTISAIAIDAGTSSAIATVAYTISSGQVVPAPTFTPATGSTIAAGQTVTIADTDANAAIYYTTDGTMPSVSSSKYTAPVALSTPGTAMLQAVAIDSGNSSTVSSATYTVTATSTPAPSFSPASGSTVAVNQTVTITDADTTATIYYTTNGTTPSATSAQYTAPIALTTTGSATIQAIAIDAGNSSQVVSATYTVTATATPTPTFTPVSGSSLTVGQTVTLADTDTSAVIYYTTDGSTPTATSTQYTVPIALTTAGSATIQAIAIDSGNNSAVASATYTVTASQTIPTPTFSPGSGAITAGQTVTIADSDPTATIYYTTDGTTPSATSTKYTTPVTLSTAGNATIEAIAIDGSNNSAVATATYTVAASTPPPTFSPASGAAVSVGQTVTLADTDTKATIYYTTDGSAPSATSTKYSAPIPLTSVGTATINAVAIDGATSSTVATATYTVTTGTPPPTFTPASGATVAVGQTVTLADTDTKATIYYTTNGTAPTSSSTKYTAPIALSTVGAATIEAIAIDGTSTSTVATATYTVAAPTPPPTFTPASGATLTVGQTVTLADTDSKATIYYTTDGSAPSSTSTKYTAPIALSNAGSVTVQAIAIDGGINSTTASATYTVVAPTPAPTFTPASGATVTVGQTVTLADTDTKATIYYTTDNSTPGATSTKYTAPIALSTAGSATIKAVAIDGASTSTVSTATYTVTAAATPAPTFNPASGATLNTGQSVTLADTDTKATIYYTTNGTAPTASSTKYTAPIVLSTAGTATINAIAIDGASTSSVSTATYTVKAAGPALSGTVQSGTLPLKDTEVQLYAASQSDYGAAATALGSPVATDSTGTFSLPYTCPASPGDLVYLVATGGDAGGGANSATELMAALGPCGKLKVTSGLVVNEVTTVASAYALSAFMTTAPNVGSSAGNYQGLTNAFATVTNLVDITTGKALSITPAYSASKPVPYLNSSTVPQARIDTLANILNSCVDTNGGGTGCSSLFGAAKSGSGSAPANTLQAALNIAQNPGKSVSGLYGLAASKGPFQPVLSAAPGDWTLALTFTGAGLGIAPGTTGTGTVAGQMYTDLGPTLNSALAIDATGNVWVAASAESAGSGAVGTLLAKFNPLGAPITQTTTQGSGATPAINYGGFNPEPDQMTGLDTVAIDQTGNVWVGDSESFGNLQGVTQNLALLAPASPISLGVNINSVAIDGNGYLWLGGSNVAEFKSDGTQLIAPANGSGPASSVLYTQLSSLAFDANTGLWGSDGYNFDVYQISTTDGSIAYDASPTGGYFTSLAADYQGNMYGCGDGGGQTLDVYNSGAIAHSYPISTGRGCGSQLIVDGLGHVFAVSNAFFPAAGAVIDEFTSGGALISPASGYSGTSAGEAPTINPDPNSSFTYSMSSAAVDGSGNLWVLNSDTVGPTNPGNVLVEFVGLAAPVVTPTSLAVQTGLLGGQRPQ